jgi:hypothetical protein
MDIHVTGWQISGEDVARAIAAPADQVPKLTTEQEKAAKGFEVSHDKYARFMLAGKYSAERMKITAERIAGTIERELSKLLPDAEPAYFQYEVGPEPHRLMVKYKDQNVWVDIPSEDDSDGALIEICKATAITLGLD